MDPQHHEALAAKAQANAAELELLPPTIPGELDRLEVVETRAGDTLVLTALEAAHYGDAQVKARPGNGTAEEVFGDRTMVALERLGRLRARTLERVALAPVDVDDLRRRLLTELEAVLAELDDQGFGATAPTETRANDAVLRYRILTHSADHLAQAWRNLDGPQLLGEPLVAQVGHVAGGLDDVTARRLAGHVYQSVAAATDTGQAELAEAARSAVLEGLAELRLEGLA